MFAEIGRLLWIIIVGIGGFKILMGLPWALCGRGQFRATIFLGFKAKKEGSFCIFLDRR